MRLSILENGTRETLKGTIHGIALCLAALIGMYNAAAWLQRRERHLGVNTVVYAALVLFECQHVRHHLGTPRQRRASAALLAAAAVATATAQAGTEKKAA